MTPVERWHLPSIAADGKREPRVLFSRPDRRAVVIDLNEGDELGNHRLHEHAVIEVVSGRLGLTLAGREVECDAGMLMTFEPGETRKVRALEPSRLLLLLTPWPARATSARRRTWIPSRMPANATVPPLE